jgi:hypothetical protein
MQKNILIHIGPPKSGSSAIQKWLSNNQEVLKQSQIWYPSHSMDINGVSSGNYRVIFSSTENGEFSLDEGLVSDLLTKFKQSDYQCLLLSSEFFFRHLQVIANAIPSCKFVAYIRSPLEFFESIYNQSVKRHNNTDLLRQPETLFPHILKKLSESIDVVGETRFILRSYVSHTQSAGGIIQDFSSILGIENIDLFDEDNAINSSYCHEALQLKKLLNRFDLDGLTHDVDQALQDFSDGIKSYSYVPPETYERYRAQCLDSLIKFTKKYSVFESSELLNNSKISKQKPFLEQVLSFDQTKKIANHLMRSHGMLYLMLCDLLNKQAGREIYMDETVQYFLKGGQPWVLHNWFRLILSPGVRMKIKLTFLRKKIKNLFNPDSVNNLDINGLPRLKANLGLDATFSDLDLIRELALFTEANKDYRLAYSLFRTLQHYRPTSAMVNYKLRLLSSRLKDVEKKSKNK